MVSLSLQEPLCWEPLIVPGRTTTTSSPRAAAAANRISDTRFEAP